MTRVGPTAEILAVQFQADAVLIYAVNGQDLSIIDIWPPHAEADRLKLELGFGVTGRVARSKKPLLLESDSPRNKLHRELLQLGPRQTVARMCLPLPGMRRRDVVGVLALSRDPSRPFDAEDLALAQPYADLLGMRIHAERLWNVVEQHQTDRDRLMQQAISAQEGERRRLAFDLHDGVTTALASMSFHLSAADLTVAAAAAAAADADDSAAFERARSELRNARALADLAYNQTRAAISGLHSLVLDDHGLVAALESLAQMVDPEQGPEVDLVVDPHSGVEELPDHVAAAMYRIAQEAVSNAVKHADASRILLSLRRMGDSIVLGCVDDGRGFDVAATRSSRAGDLAGDQHFGMSSIAERCAMIEASLRVESENGRGTSVLVEYPIGGDDAEPVSAPEPLPARRGSA